MSSPERMHATNALMLTITMALGVVAPGCMVPETPRTWVSYHARIAPASPVGGWTAEEISFIQDSLTVSAAHCGMKPTTEWLGPDWLGIGGRKNARALADLAAGKQSTFCHLAEFSKDQGGQVEAYYMPYMPSRLRVHGGKTNIICIDYTYLKTAPITPPEEQRADLEWATFFEVLKAKFESRLEVDQDKLLRRPDQPAMKLRNTLLDRKHITELVERCGE